MKRAFSAASEESTKFAQSFDRREPAVQWSRRMVRTPACRNTTSRWTRSVGELRSLDESRGAIRHLTFSSRFVWRWLLEVAGSMIIRKRGFPSSSSNSRAWLAELATSRFLVRRPGSVVFLSDDEGGLDGSQRRAELSSVCMKLAGNLERSRFPTDHARIHAGKDPREVWCKSTLN
jgi:hypothetical protein